MPRTLPSELEAAMEKGTFNAYIAIGRRLYERDEDDNPVSISGYETLIENILYYEYDGRNLTVKWASENLPYQDGFIIFDMYYIERGIKILEQKYTIKSCNLRLDSTKTWKNITTAKFSIFSDKSNFTTIDGYDTYQNVITAANPNALYLGTINLKETPENTNHWNYKFFEAGKQIVLSNQASFQNLLRQKYLIEVVDNSDYAIENEIQFFTLRSPISGYLQPDHIIIQENVEIQNNKPSKMFIWKDENRVIHISGNGVIKHNLGYLESTASPPSGYQNSTPARLETGINLKYKTGDIFKLGISSTQYAIYHAVVTEILDPKNEIGWRTKIELFERFRNTEGGSIPSSIGHVAPYSQLSTTGFDNNLDETTNNLQSLANAVDDLDPKIDASAFNNNLDNTANSLQALANAVDDLPITAYAPSNNANWDSSADPGDVNNALDQLAQRVKIMEGQADSPPALLIYINQNFR